MPKKTKKEKLLAVYRKRLHLLEQASQQPLTKMPEPTPSLTSETVSKTTVNEQVVAPRYFFTDLRKSLILVVIIIALEIGLYFAKLIK
ncbi:hypothetical protein COY13_00570 [Candidatus Roizmanbacteria bacterium CG_4_10_14_0_2_um_filter_36_35]|uniref:Uncharacterized protein n=4 Tax=Candidatus Roizmaniibacteriota TaxID=1752723 RepID=A0A2M7BX79_9BACT|nr:MAG: hypothetical protein COV86_04425 [Candidatus Roizmanbacteria bacterium CG11_big_fil_rev_8_21_14_0_20_35_14]PIV11171.1 MAG: hypothetical protein COS50_01680 [Candidatus Roizmanbacteria bacterium CG03_land_8_20_14_0_80_35_26]PIZ68720.1 MAG: hypothetical protein COY13_00570 [Candidatus Roizmanbacteria bacterium CG_4_10_14_0_2_um_filter_36_35]PJC33044.1 MAG: hypothetical protein CO049_01245 [Candidatus Roizmanbacteria bacterium CG_4_9_14_0_2_um_filter_36_12]